MGFAKGRRREVDVKVVRCVGWRSRKAGISHADSLKYMSNAFGSTRWELLRKANRELMMEMDVEIGSQRFEWSTVRLTGNDGVVTLKPGVGALIGDPYAVASFPKALHHPVASWQVEQRLYDSMYDALYVRCLVTNVLT